MKHVRLPRHGWIIACDGGKALFLRNDGDAELISLSLVEALSHEDPPTRELGADRPGRVHQSQGQARSAVGQTDWHAESEAAFLREVATHLDTLVKEHRVRHLTIAAPPKALGVLRDHITPGVRAVVNAELAKDLAGLTTSEMEKHFSNCAAQT